MQSFFQVAQQTDRALVINLKQAYLLELFKASGIATPRIDDDQLRSAHSSENVGCLQG